MDNDVLRQAPLFSHLDDEAATALRSSMTESRLRRGEVLFHEGDSGEIIPRTIVRMLAGYRPVLYGTGEQTRDLCHVHDTAAGLVALAECPAAVGETVNLGTGTEVTMRELCRVITEAVGRPDLPPVKLPARPGDVGRLLVDHGRMTALTGWRAERRLADGIAELVDWFRNCGRTPAELAAEVATTNWSPEPVTT